MSRSTSRKVSSKRSNAVTSNGAFVRKNRASYSKQTWVVFTKDGNRMVSPRVYDAKLTRDAVRGAYSREFGVSKEETRSRRVFNVK